MVLIFLIKFMGYTTAKERIESRMLTLKMKRLAIKEEKQKYFDLYERLTGQKLQRNEYSTRRNSKIKRYTFYKK